VPSRFADRIREIATILELRATRWIASEIGTATRAIAPDATSDVALGRTL
jgi:hypothetical protein